MGIPVNEPLLDGNEKKYLCECIDTGWISSEGPYVEKFEQSFARAIGTEHAVAVTSGTAALETALYALGIGPGDEVIMPSFTIMSCAIACLRLGAKPVLVDIEPQTWTMDVGLIAEKITPRTRAVMPVHIYGHPVNMDELFRLKDKHGFTILEDAAEVHGAQYHSSLRGGCWLNCGAMGDCSATSFYANKIITTGEGGMVLTDSADCAERARSYRNLCFRPEERFYHTEVGYNFRMTNLQAAVGLAQTEQLERFIKIKQRRGQYYRERLTDIPGIRFMPVMEWARSVYWMYGVELNPDTGLSAKEMMARLRTHGIGTRPFFRGLHSQPALQQRGLFLDERYPRTDFAATYGFYLPSGLTLTEDQIDQVAKAIETELK
ncbi:MAG: DegT/DnrJ/EryC1/StrS family aminotransferase [Deltaproteobacteria bacterium]|nr:DegT/DnrJ/EryC1/StrS family aminotransferase [Deltaproteobacteria bacterium]